MKQKIGPNHQAKLIWNKLSDVEKQMLQKMMMETLNKKMAKNISANMTKSWDDLETGLFEAMKINHISDARAEKIIKDTNDIVDRKHGIELGTRDINKYIVLNKEQFSYLIEAAACKCENCFEKPEDCELYKLMKAKCVPEPTGYKLQVCKYAYGKEVV